MADNSTENDACAVPPNVQNEPQTVDPRTDAQGRETPGRTNQQSIQAPYDDWEFDRLLLNLSKQLTDEDTENLVFRFGGALGKAVQEKIKKPMHLLRIMKERHWLTRDNLLTLQAALRDIERMDLVRVTAEYAQKLDNVLYFYPPSESVNGYTSVKFHLYNCNYENTDRNQIQMKRLGFSELVGCAPENIVIVGLEPATSLILTFHVPESFVCLFKELVKMSSCKARLRDIGIDMVEIEGEDEIFDCSDENVRTKPTTEEQKKLYNVYQLLKNKEELLDSAEAKRIELDEKIETLENEKFQCEALLKSLKPEFVKSAGNVSPDKEDLLKKFQALLQRPELASYDKALILSLLDTNTQMVSSTVAAGIEIRVQEMQLEIMKLRSQVEPVQFELLKMRIFTDHDELDKRFLESFKRLQQTLRVSQEVTVQVNENVIIVLKKLSRALRSQEREKLVKMYSWEPNEDIKQLMDNDSSFCLVAILHKEIRLKQMLIDPAQFIRDCLEKVNRKDLEKKYLSMLENLNKAKETTDRRKQKRSRSLDREENAAPQVNDAILQQMADQLQELHDLIIPAYEEKKTSPYFGMFSPECPSDNIFTKQGSFNAAKV